MSTPCMYVAEVPTHTYQVAKVLHVFDQRALRRIDLVPGHGDGTVASCAFSIVPLMVTGGRTMVAVGATSLWVLRVGLPGRRRRKWWVGARRVARLRHINGR